MIWIAIATQLILSAFLLWASWQVWMLRKSLEATVQTVDGWTEACHNGLQGSNPSLKIARVGVGSTRKQYQILQSQLVKFQNLVSVLTRGVSFVRNRWQKFRKGSLKGGTDSLNYKSSRIKQNVKRRR
jgi:hypothetical protein